MRLFHAADNEPDVVCCVCDQFLRLSNSKLIWPTSPPPAFLKTIATNRAERRCRSAASYAIGSGNTTFPKCFPTTADLTSCFYRRIEKHRILWRYYKHRLDYRKDVDSGCDCEPQLRFCNKKVLKVFKTRRFAKVFNRQRTLARTAAGRVTRHDTWHMQSRSSSS